MSEPVHQVVAIDGPSASGKSTVARRVAADLGFLYVDSGSVYRAVTWRALREGVEPRDAAAAGAWVEGLELGFEVAEGAVRVAVEGLDSDAALRTEEVTRHVSPVAAVPAVRRRVTGWLRGLRERGCLVMEGRDIGTAVFPDARWKFYLDASPAERARRRHAETAGATGRDALARTDRALRRRDAIDSSRLADPLRVAAGAEVIDTTALSIDQVARAIAARVRAGRRQESGS